MSTSSLTNKPHIISVVSTKGGAGKTTLSANLAGYLTSLGKKVLMIDLDPQPSLSSYYDIENLKKHNNGSVLGLTEVFHNPKIINDCISSTKYGDIIISNDSKYQLQTFLLNEADGRFRLKIALKNITKKYDVIIIDTQGSKGTLQDASVLAADILLSPIPPELAAIREFHRGTISLLKSLKTFESLGITLPKLFGVIYKADNTTDSQQFINLLRAKEDKRYKLLQSQIPQAVIFKEATTKQIPIFELNKTKKQRIKSEKSIKALVNLVEELGL